MGCAWWTSSRFIIRSGSSNGERTRRTRTRTMEYNIAKKPVCYARGGTGEERDDDRRPLKRHAAGKRVLSDWNFRKRNDDVDSTIRLRTNGRSVAGNTEDTTSINRFTDHKKNDKKSQRLGSDLCILTIIVTMMATHTRARTLVETHTTTNA